MGITTSQPVGGVTRTPVFPGRDNRSDRIEILANPIAAEDPRLARAVELEVRRQLRHEDVGPVEVRFRVCRDDGEGLRFICKVENPPSDGEDGRLQWRWWSPLMETAEEFRSALEEGLRIRRARLSGRARTA